MTETEALEFAFGQARDDVRRGRDVLAVATIINSNGDYALLGCENPGNFELKMAWLSGIRSHIREHRAIAVVLTAGVNRAIYTDEGSQEVRRLRAQGIVLSISEAMQFGWCTKTDAIMATVQTPLATIVHMQDYKRVGRKTDFGEVITLDSNAVPSMSGFLTNLFDGVPDGVRPS